MLKPKGKILLAMVFCLLTGMVIGAAATAMDYDDRKFAAGCTCFAVISVVLTGCYIWTVFKTIHVQSRLDRILEDAVNISHVD